MPEAVLAHIPTGALAYQSCCDWFQKPLHQGQQQAHHLCRQNRRGRAAPRSVPAMADHFALLSVAAATARRQGYGCSCPRCRQPATRVTETEVKMTLKTKTVTAPAVIERDHSQSPTMLPTFRRERTVLHHPHPNPRSAAPAGTLRHQRRKGLGTLLAASWP